MVRERTRSDREFPDIGQQLGWQLYWEHATLLTEDARGEGSAHTVQIGRDDAEHAAASLAARYWPPDAAQLPWVKNAYPLACARAVRAGWPNELSPLVDAEICPGHVDQ